MAQILGVDDDNVTAIIRDDLGHADIDFFISNPNKETRKMCESGEMPPKLLRALSSDDKVAPLLASSKGIMKLYFFFSFFLYVNLKSLKTFFFNQSNSFLCCEDKVTSLVV